MKKRILAMLTAAFVLATAVPVFAASPTTTTTSAVEGQNAKVTVQGSGSAEAKAAVTNLLNDASALGDVLGSQALKDAAKNGNIVATVGADFDLTKDSAGVKDNGNGTYSYNRQESMVNAGDLAFVLHNYSDVIKSDSVNTGSVDFTTSGFSPFNVVKLTVNGSSSGTTTGKTVSAPKTADTMPMAVWFVGAGAVVALAFGKKHNA